MISDEEMQSVMNLLSDDIPHQNEEEDMVEGFDVPDMDLMFGIPQDEEQIQTKVTPQIPEEKNQGGQVQVGGIPEKDHKTSDKPPKKPKQVFGGEKPVQWKGRHFQLTLNDPDLQYKPVKDYLMGLKHTNYFISCLEKAPQTGHKHIHIYVQFEKASRIAQSRLHGAHVEVCRGSPQQNVAYIRKENDEEKRGEILDEWGELRKVGNPNIKEMKEMSPEELDELPGQMYNIVQKIQEKKSKRFNADTVGKTVTVYYIWGPSGIGKTVLAKKITKIWGQTHEEGGDFNMVKYENGFWAEAEEECAIALYDDFRDGDMRPREFINFIDYNIHSMNIKGGSIKNRYKLIVITSVQHPEDLYDEFSKKDSEPRKQWMRRMHIIHLDDKSFIRWTRFKLLLIKLFKYKLFNLIFKHKK